MIQKAMLGSACGILRRKDPLERKKPEIMPPYVERNEGEKHHQKAAEETKHGFEWVQMTTQENLCLLYTSDAADE